MMAAPASPRSAMDRRSVFLFACFVAALVLISAYCTDRDGAVDETGFLNPPYMLAHFGRLTFPVFPFNGFFDLPVITHPPVHTLWIGLLWRAGFTPYYAEATPTVLLMLLSIAIVVRSAFPTAVKLGWLFSIAYLAASGEGLTLCYGSRPEGEIQAAWMCGLLLLETGRLEDWNRLKLAAGALFFTWASGTHYYAGPAAAGVLVYLVWAIWKLGWKQAKPRVIAMCVGSGLFVIPYFALYVIPYFHEISTTIRNTVGQGGVALSMQRHFALYKNWAQETYHPELIRKMMGLGIPLLLFSTAILAAIRSTRGAALAALPLQLGVFLLVWRKMPYYIVHESVFFAAAVAIGALVLVHTAIARWAPKVERAFAPAAAIVLVVCAAKGSATLANARITLSPRINEMELAHAAGQRMLGTHARMGGRWWAWYASGAEHWYDVERDLNLGFLEFDPLIYMRNLDALEVCPSMDSPGRPTAWYADGTLKLRGFYFAETNTTLRCVLLNEKGISPLVGYAMVNNQIYRFEQSELGDYELLSGVCPPGSPDWSAPRNGVFTVTFAIPEAKDKLIAIMGPRRFLAPQGQIGVGCREVSRIRGTFLLDEWPSLLDWSRKNSPPMRFYRNIEDMPRYQGVGLPAQSKVPPDLAPVGGLTLDLSKLNISRGARLEHAPQVRLSTIPLPGAFSAGLPLPNHESLNGPCWIVLTLRVRSGRVGFGAFDRLKGFVAKTQAINLSPEPQKVALYVPDPSHVTDVIVFNDGIGSAEVDIFDASVMAHR
ncbi:MAG TPA: hypothetical protein VKT81_10780 [Bryobacteraceae bacterium]|nr:hypothetical protein [Bryobacteraceae bacterium]